MKIVYEYVKIIQKYTMDLFESSTNSFELLKVVLHRPGLIFATQIAVGWGRSIGLLTGVEQ